LLLAGKGHECYEIDREGVRAFDERCVVREALNRLYE
jgi:UDP-N-acetylmuramyl tripeptide synthase